MAKNNLPKLKQIQGGLQLQNNVTALQQYLANLTASQVATTIPDPSNEGKYLNTAQVLSVLYGDNGTYGEDIETLKQDIATLENTPITDYVRLTGKVTVSSSEVDGVTNYSYEASFDDTEGLAELRAQALEVNNKCILYREDNTVVTDANGVPVTINLANGVLSGNLFIADTDNTESETLVYEPIAEDFTFKVFPVGNYTLSTVPANFLLDNDEMKAVYYQNAIDELAFKLSQNSSLLDSIKELVGSKSVEQALSDLKAEITNAYQAADNALGERIDTVSARVEEVNNTLAADIAENAEDIENNALAINILNGDAETEGSVAKAVKDAVDPVAGRVSVTENQINVLNGDSTVVGSVANTVKSVTDPMKEATTALEGKVTSNTNALATLNGDAETEGSVAKAVKDAVDPVANDLSALTDRVSTNETNISTNADDIDALEASVEGINTEINGIKEAIESSNTDITDLTDTVNRLDGKEEIWDAQSAYSNTNPTVASIGGVGVGETFDNMPITDLLTKILYPYVKPEVVSFASSTEGVAELGYVYDTTNLSATFAKKSEEISSAKFLVNGTEVYSDDLADTDMAYTYDVAVNSDTTFKVEVTDAKNSVASATKTIKFYNPAYIGLVDSDVVVDGTVINSLEKKVQAPSSFDYTLSSFSNKKIVVLLPPSWTLSSIYDNNGFNIFASFTKSTVTVNCLDGTERTYNAYVSNVCSLSNSATYKFNK